MRESLVVGILRETKYKEYRVPLTPKDVDFLIKRGINVEVESSSTRIFKDQEYQKYGARIVDKFDKASLLIGIKEPHIEDLYENRIYLLFSHVTKGQAKNMPLLRQFIKKNITLIDYEKIVDKFGTRIVYFGRFAGICGAIDSLSYMGRKLKWMGIDNPFSAIKPAFEYKSLKEAKKALKEVKLSIKNEGFEKDLSPFIVGVTGHGNASGGVQEILDILNPVEIHPKNMLEFVQDKRKKQNELYKIVFLREEKCRAKDGGGFYFEEYLKNPQKFESNLDMYLPYINMLMHTSYWDPRYPRLVSKEMINKLSENKLFKLAFIGDISCDISGSIELNYKATTPDDPVYTYDYEKKKYIDGYKSDGITILAIDNLPSELPLDSSEEFSMQIRDYVYQIAAHGIYDITNHVAIPKEIRDAVIVEEGELTEDFAYLKEYLDS